MTSNDNNTSGTVENGGPRFIPEPASGFMLFMDIVNTMTHLTLGAVAFVVIFIGISYNTVYRPLGQHVILCVLGYIILMTQSVLVMSSTNGCFRSIRYQDRKIVHLVLHVIGASLALAGSIIIMMEKDAHFNSTHGILGIIALIFTFLSVIGGAIHLFTCLPRVTGIFHLVIGGLTLIIAFLALIFGIDNAFRVFGDGSTNTLIALTVFSLIGTLLPSCLKLQRKCF